MSAWWHTRTHTQEGGVVSPRSDWSAGHLRIRLRNELSTRAWKRLAGAANRAGTNVEGLLQSFLEAR
jgi:hypothetical protein